MRIAFALAVALGATTVWADMVNLPAFIGAPDHRRSVTQRAITLVPSLAVAPNGRLWATWYAGPTPAEDLANYVVLSTSDDDGRTWQEVCVVDPDGDGPRRTFDPEIWISPDGHLRWFWTDRDSWTIETTGLWMMDLGDPNVVPAKLPTPRCVSTGVMMCKPTALANGEWLFPVAQWKAQPSSCFYVSTDAGRTFALRGGVELPVVERLFDEHQVVEKKDGRLWCFSRTMTGLREAYSSDRGATWTPSVYPAGIRHTSSRFFLRRLASGNLLFVKHGPVDRDVGRRELTAYLSRDDGKTWEGGLLLDERNRVSYPDGQQAADGTIYLTYDFDRTNAREVLFCTFREEDVFAGKNVSGRVALRQIVTKSRGR